MQHWFTSDWHLFHDKMASNRSLSIKDMNELIISNVFDVVKPNDNLYFLGDIGWKFPQGYLETLFTDFKRHRINFHWIEGNHDSSIKIDSSSIKWRGQIKDIVVNKQPITLSHYPLIIWNKSHYNAWNLYGHIHYRDNTYNKIMSLANNPILLSKRLNVNIEYYDLKPISFDYILDIFSDYGKDLYRNFDLIPLK